MHDQLGWQHSAEVDARRVRVRVRVVTEPPFKLGKPCVRQPRGDTRATPEDKHRAAEQRAAEIAKRRADFNATDKVVHWQP